MPPTHHPQKGEKKKPTTQRKEKSEKKVSNQVADWYHKVPRSLVPELANPQFNQHRFKVPFRACIVGPSGSFKTTIFCDFLKRSSGTFDKVVFVVRSMSEPLYQTILHHTPSDMIEVYEDEKLPNVEDYKDYAMTDRQILMVFDDLIGLPKPKQKPIVDMFIKGRKYNISMIYISQDYFKIPKSARLQMNYIILTRTNSERDIKLILSEFTLGHNSRLVINLYRSVFKQPRDFFLISIDDQKFRRNWLEDIEIEPQWSIA